MPIRSSKKTKDEDFMATARRVVEQAIGEPLNLPKQPLPLPKRKKNPAAVALGKLGGMKGGAARAKSLSPEERKAIAQRAAKARWAKERA